MSKPLYAVVEILCDASKLAKLKAIANLEIEVRVMRTPDPAVIRISALADDQAQAAARDLGCTVRVIKSADDYRRQIEDAYRGLGQDPDPAVPKRPS